MRAVGFLADLREPIAGGTPKHEGEVLRMGVTHAVVRYGYCPLMLLGVNGIALWLVSEGAAKIWLLVLLAGAVALSFAAGRLLPYERDWNRSHGDRTRDLLHAIVKEGANFGTLLLLPLITSLLAFDGI